MNDAGAGVTEPTLRLDARALGVIALLALVAAAPSLVNGFAYDDYWIIVNNERVHSLSRWADWFQTSYWPTRDATLYRPLTTTAFALQWWIGGGSPLMFHIVNVALYVAGAVAVARLAGLLLPAPAALMAGAVFAVHPVHVEASANVVGQSELFAGLTMVVATTVYIRARRAGPLQRQTTLGLAALYLVGALFKEHALTLPAWFVVAELTVLRDVGGALRARLVSLLPLLTLFATVAALALVARWSVLGAIGGDLPHPVLRDAGAGGRALIMLGVLPDLARLLVWPAGLYADYSPAHVIVSPDPSPGHINGLVIAIGAILIIVVAWRHSRAAAFGLLVAAAAWLPTANILFPSGILLSERTLYVPSAGVAIAVGVGLAWLARRSTIDARYQRAAAVAFALVLLAGIARSVDRARVWRSNDELFWTMRRDEPDSFRARYVWGNVLFQRGDLRGGEAEWRAAIRIFPNYPNVYEDLGHQYREHGLCRAAIPMYESALRINPRVWSTRQGLTVCQLALAQFRAARQTARLGMVYGDFHRWFRDRAFSAESALVATDSVKR